jgi:4-carboxymuconolactone decarboxylase
MQSRTKTHLLIRLIALATLLPCGAQAQQGADPESAQRFKLIPVDALTPAQRELSASIQSGPRAAIAGSAANTGGKPLGSPFNVFLRSPEVGEHLQRVGSYIRFKSSLGPKLTEMAILITARHWTSQYEWFAHHRLALQAGLDPKIAEAIAQGKRPTTMASDEAIVYDFSHELHQQKSVSDATYQKMVERFGEHGVMDLIAVNGYYVTISMVLNVDRTPIPGNGPLPLAPLPVGH